MGNQALHTGFISLEKILGPVKDHLLLVQSFDIISWLLSRYQKWIFFFKEEMDLFLLLFLKLEIPTRTTDLP